MCEDKVNYYAIIPANVRYDKRLSASAKLMYGEITALCNQDGYCWATNNYFGNLYEVSERTIIRCINLLVDYGYISRKIIYQDNSKEVKARILSINNSLDLPTDKNVTPSNKNVITPTDENVTENNTSINNNISTIHNTNNNLNISSNSISIIHSTCCSSDEVQRIVDYWNEQLASFGIKEVKSIKPTVQRYKMLQARLKQYSVDEILQAIDQIKRSTFLCGENKKGWQITFDWFVRPNNFPKVLDGNYTDKLEHTFDGADEQFDYTFDKYPKKDNYTQAKRVWLSKCSDSNSSHELYKAMLLYIDSLKGEFKFCKSFDNWILNDSEYWIKEVRKH